MKRIASYKLQLVREGSHLYETKTITGIDTELKSSTSIRSLPEYKLIWKGIN